MSNTPEQDFTFDWSKFKIRIPIYTEPQKIYEMWTSQNGLESWFLSKAEFMKPDNSLRERNSGVEASDEYTFMWWGYKGDEEKGRIISANGKDMFQFSFAGECVVTVTLKMIEGACMVELVQENIPTDEKSKANFHVGCSQGWTFYFANIKSILEGGKDLRNKNEKLIQVINS